MSGDEALIDLLGLLAYGELSAFDHLAEDAQLAPTMPGREQMSAMAAFELGHHQLLAARLTDMGVDPAQAMEPFIEPLTRYHSLTQPSSWLEAIVKAYIGDGMAADFYREVATFVDPATRGLIEDVINDGGRADFALREVSSAIAQDPRLASSLALWARRLVGEAISQTQHTLGERDALLDLFVAGVGDLAGVAALITRITDRHKDRMLALGLSN